MQHLNDTVERLDVRRAKQVLIDMVEYPFFLLVFLPDGAEAVVKGLDDDAVDLIRAVLAELGND
jgi:hypothetical protein